MNGGSGRAGILVLFLPCARGSLRFQYHLTAIYLKFIATHPVLFTLFIIKSVSFSI